MSTLAQVDRDELRHRKIPAAPFTAMMRAHDYIFRQLAEWTLEVRLAASDMLLGKAYGVSLEQSRKGVGGRP